MALACKKSPKTGQLWMKFYPKETSIYFTSHLDSIEFEVVKKCHGGRSFRRHSHWPHGQVPYEITNYGDVEKEVIRAVSILIHPKYIQHVEKPCL